MRCWALTACLALGFDETQGALKAAPCGDAACTTAVVTIVDSNPVVGRTSVAIGADGLPLIVYARRRPR